MLVVMVGLIEEEEGEDLRTPAYLRFIPEQELWKGNRGKNFDSTSKSFAAYKNTFFEI